MSLEPYDPMASQSFYDNYYQQQVGNGLQVYSGRRHMPQSGAGIGSLFSGLLKAAAPIAKNLGRRALSAGARVASDVVRGRSFKDAAKAQFRDEGADFLDNLDFSSSSVKKRRGTTRGGKRRNKSQAGKGLSSKRRKINTIF